MARSTSTRWCECADSGCSTHKGVSECTRPATNRLTRIDVYPMYTVYMCGECAVDAVESGVFS